MIALPPKALARWRWMRGQSAIDDAGESSLVIDVDETGPLLESDGRHAVHPDLSDEVTALSLPAVVRAAWAVVKTAWSAEDMYCRPDDLGPLRSRWTVIIWSTDGNSKQTFNGDTEAEAWLAALEAAP